MASNPRKFDDVDRDNHIGVDRPSYSWMVVSFSGSKGGSLEISPHQSARLGKKNRILGKFGSNPNSIHHRSNLVHKGHKHSIHMA